VRPKRGRVHWCPSDAAARCVARLRPRHRADDSIAVSFRDRRSGSAILGKADPQAAGSALGDALGLHEELEAMRRELGRHPLATVADGDRHGVRCHFDRDADEAAFLGNAAATHKPRSAP